MPAYISVHTGLTAGSKLWIEKRVVRVGSDPACDICIPAPNLPAHLLTVEFRDGRYYLNKRSDGLVQLEGHDVVSSQPIEWTIGARCQLAEDVIVSLGLEGSPDPAPRPRSIADETYDAEIEEVDVSLEDGGEKKKGVDAKFIAQLAVIVLCVLGCIFLLLRDPSSTDTSQAEGGSPPTMSELLEEFEGSRKSRTVNILMKKVQFAELARIRGDEGESKERLTAVRDELILEQQRLSGEDLEFLNRLLAFVQYRLSD